jgi:hypothetical protein
MCYLDCLVDQASVDKKPGKMGRDKQLGLDSSDQNEGAS